MNFNEICDWLRSQGWRGTFIADEKWIVIIGTYQHFGDAHNDNEAKP